MTRTDSIEVTVEVKNTGDRAGEEVVQLYIRDLVASIVRPVKELKDFEKILLQPGETKSVRFVITNETLQFYNGDLEHVSEPGEFKVFVGNSSNHVQESSFQLVE